jgi:hypothetical protein
MQFLFNAARLADFSNFRLVVKVRYYYLTVTGELAKKIAGIGKIKVVLICV